MWTLEWVCSRMSESFHFNWERMSPAIECFCRWSRNCSSPWILSKAILESFISLPGQPTSLSTRWFSVGLFFKGSSCFNTTDRLTLSHHQNEIHFMTTISLGCVSPCGNWVKAAPKECPLREGQRGQWPAQKVWKGKVVSKSWNKNSFELTWLVYKTSRAIFVLH